MSVIAAVIGGIFYCRRKQLLCFKTNITASGDAHPAAANNVMYVEQPLGVAHVQYAVYPPGPPPQQLYGGAPYPGPPAPPVWK